MDSSYTSHHFNISSVEEISLQGNFEKHEKLWEITTAFSSSCIPHTLEQRLEEFEKNRITFCSVVATSMHFEHDNWNCTKTAP